MTHPASFVDAHRWHWEDAELLFENQRWASADQSYGISAECGLKAVMKGLGMPVDHFGRPTDWQYAKHVQDLWPAFATFVTNRSGARYLAKLPPGQPFIDWSHHNRYAHRSHSQESDVKPHREAARQVCQMVQKATQDGLPL